MKFGKTGKVFGLAILLLFFAGCAPVPPEPAPIPPAQNLLGSTDELQLVAELSFDLASRYGGEHVLAVLDIDTSLLLEAGSAAQIQRMQDAGLKLIMLTARGPEDQARTKQELSDNGFSFLASAWPPQTGYPGAFIPAEGARPVLYQDGVFLTNGQDKGLMLKALLDKSGQPSPTLIVIADSEQANLNSVMKAFSRSGTKVHAWRYTRGIGTAD